MFQVPWIVKFEVVRVEKTGTNCFDLFAARTAVVKRAAEGAVKKPLGRVQKTNDYLRFLG